MLKKFGMVSVGVTAGLLAIAPMASASEGHGHHGHEGHHGHSKSDNRSCDFRAGDAAGEADTEASGLLAGTGTSIVDVIGGSNAANVGNCSDILSDNLNDNQLNALAFASDNER